MNRQENANFVPVPWEKAKVFIDPETKIKLVINKLPLRFPRYSFSIGYDRIKSTPDGDEELKFMHHLPIEFTDINESKGYHTFRHDYVSVIKELLEQAEAWVLSDFDEVVSRRNPK